MAVKIGSARIDENGKAYGGKAGDQTGKEVSTQDWYRYKKSGKYVDWRVIRAKDNKAAQAIAVAMERACANPAIGYDQYQRDSLLNNVAQNGYDTAKTTKSVETDCSALVRVCVAYAFGRDVVGDVLRNRRFSTANMCGILLETGLFVEYKGVNYAQKSDYLKRGDILCTNVQAHTVVVLSNGSKADTDTPKDDSLRKGDKGNDVKAMQVLLLKWNANCLPKCGADGDFGTETFNAVKAFQAANGLTANGVCDKITLDKLSNYHQKKIIITGASVNVRSNPNLDSTVLKVVHKNDEFDLIETNADGWHKTSIGWISGKWSKEV